MDGFSKVETPFKVSFKAVFDNYEVHHRANTTPSTLRSGLEDAELLGGQDGAVNEEVGIPDAIGFAVWTLCAGCRPPRRADQRSPGSG